MPTMVVSFSGAPRECGDDRARLDRVVRRAGVRTEALGEARDTDRPLADLATPRLVVRPRLADRPRPPPAAALVSTI